MTTILTVCVIGLISFVSNDPVLIEAESFDDTGGWVIDQQFIDLMGSPFLLAHGLGTPVEDAQHTLMTKPGDVRVWVRTRNWVAPWNTAEKTLPPPGKFEILIDGKPLAVTFGTTGEPWRWHDGGVVTLQEKTTLAIRDLTGFDGRCDAILLSPNLTWRPPEDPQELAQFRDTFRPPEEELEAFDLVVVGGGVAGTSAAITAARLGLSVALIQNRPVLGGNSSSEVRVWPQGKVQLDPWPKIGDVVMEVIPVKGPQSKNAQDGAVFDDSRKERLVAAEENITLLLNQHVNGVEMSDDGKRIVAVRAENIRSGARTRIPSALFLDSTGDGCVGALAGADFDITETGHMGASNLWNIQCLCNDKEPLAADLEQACEDAAFPRCPWALDLSDKPFPGRDWGSTEAKTGEKNPISIGNWYWENGFDRDSLADMERIRDYNFRAIFGAWDAIKNIDRRYPAHRLNWVAYIAGKRESRRLLGDVILTAEDLRAGKTFPDGCFPCTWGIDTHFPNPRYSKGFEDEPFIADYTRGDGYTYDGPYWVPYRCLYSRSVDNLFMAGRNISVTHEALGAVRVMKTTGCMGEIVGMAASICREEECGPRDVYREHLDQLQNLMSKGAGKTAVQGR